MMGTFLSLAMGEKTAKPTTLAGDRCAIRRKDGNGLLRVAPLVGEEKHDAGLPEIAIDKKGKVLEARLITDGTRTRRDKDKEMVLTDA